MHPTARTNPRAIQMALDRMQSTLCGRIRAMLAGTDAGFIGEFPSLVAEVEAGFRHEEALMEFRNDARVHARREDNATILCALHRVAPQVELGNVCLGRQVAAALHDVISAHRLSTGRALFSSVLPAPLRWRTHALRLPRPAGVRHARCRH